VSSETRIHGGEDRGWGRWSTLGLSGMFLLLLVAWSCTPKGAGIYESTRAAVAQVDDFGMLLLEAGLAPGAIPSGEVVTVEQAQRLRMLLRLAMADGNMKGYGPRVTADLLLTEAVTAGGVVSRGSLNERLRRFKGLAVLRPDGYLALAITGAPLQCVGPVQMQGNDLQAGDFKVGPFYTQEGGSFREDPSIPPRAAFLSGAEVFAQPK
jgi:hypothetical protein